MGRDSLMNEIEGLGHQEDIVNKEVVVPDVRASSVSSSRKDAVVVAGSGLAAAEDGVLKETWNPYLPRPPSMRQLTDEVDQNAEKVAVFQGELCIGTVEWQMPDNSA